MTQLTCLVLNCTLKKAPSKSSTELLGSRILDALAGTTRTLAANTAHLAGLLSKSPYPASS